MRFLLRLPIHLDGRIHARLVRGRVSGSLIRPFVLHHRQPIVDHLHSLGEAEVEVVVHDLTSSGARVDETTRACYVMPLRMLRQLDRVEPAEHLAPTRSLCRCRQHAIVGAAQEAHGLDDGAGTCSSRLQERPFATV